MRRTPGLVSMFEESRRRIGAEPGCEVKPNRIEVNARAASIRDHRAYHDAALNRLRASRDRDSAFLAVELIASERDRSRGAGIVTKTQPDSVDHHQLKNLMPRCEKVQHICIELLWILQHRKGADARLDKQARVGNQRHLFRLLPLDRLVVVSIGDNSRNPDTANVEDNFGSGP